MNKFVVLSLAYVALLAGCSLSNRFFIPGTNSDKSTCGFIFMTIYLMINLYTEGLRGFFRYIFKI